MNKSQLPLSLLLALIVIGIAFGLLSMRTTAQEGVVSYLEERFKELNIPVTEITILTESPLHLQVVVQRTSESASFDEFLTLHAIEREVFITARQHGYAVDRLAKILVDSQGKKLSYEDTGFNTELMIVDVSPSILSNEETRELASNLLVDKYKLYGNFTTNVNVSSVDGLQTLNIQLIAPLPEEVNKIMDFVHLVFIFAEDVNAQGAQIVMITVEAKDEKDHVFLSYMYDVQLNSATWFQDENVINLSEGPPSDLIELLTQSSPSTETVTITPTP